jgi:hypothetical protein
LTSDLLPAVSLLTVISGINVLSAHDLVVRSNTADLAVTNADMHQVGSYFFPASTNKVEI